MKTRSPIARISRALCLFALFAGLAAAPATLSAMASKPGVVVVELKDGEVAVQQGKEKTKAGNRSEVEVTLVAGQRLKLRLRANVTTGYSWAINGEVPRCIAAVGDPTYIQDEAHGAEGVGGWSEWVFSAKEVGAGVLPLVYRQPWDQAAPPAQSLTVKVTVPAIRRGGE